MNKKLKRAIRDGFAAPVPVGKKEFLRGLSEPPIGNFEFIITQLGYIRKWVWAAAVLIFALAVIGSESGGILSGAYRLSCRFWRSG